MQFSQWQVTHIGFFKGIHCTFKQYVQRENECLPAFICMHEWRSLRRAITTGTHRETFILFEVIVLHSSCRPNQDSGKQ